MANDEKDKGARDKSYTIKVNGRERTVTEKKQSYRYIAALAYPDPNFDQFLYTITFLKGEGGHEGDLAEGETVTVKDGMIFNVRRSDRS